MRQIKCLRTLNDLGIIVNKGEQNERRTFGTETAQFPVYQGRFLDTDAFGEFRLRLPVATRIDFTSVSGIAK